MIFAGKLLEDCRPLSDYKAKNYKLGLVEATSGCLTVAADLMPTLHLFVKQGFASNTTA